MQVLDGAGEALEEIIAAEEARHRAFDDRPPVLTVCGNRDLLNDRLPPRIVWLWHRATGGWESIH